MDSDFLEIRADTPLFIEITTRRDGKPATMILRMVGGDWRIGPPDGSPGRSIAGKRIDWHEALKRALKEISP